MAQPSPFSNVPTKDSIAAQRKIAMALQGQAIDTSPVGHWTQALARAVQGGVGGMNQSAAAAGEKSRQDALAQALAGSGTFGGLSEGDRAIMANDDGIMRSVATSALGKKLDPNAGINRQLLELKLKNLQTTGGEEYGKSGAIFKNPDGTFSAVQFGGRGNLKTHTLGKGVEPAKGVKAVGDELVSNATGQTVRNVAPQIAGGETAKEIGDARGKFVATYPKAAMAVESLNAKRDIVQTEINEARKVLNSASTGAASVPLKYLPGTDAYKLKAHITTILANVGFEELNQMRAESPTGGALGQVAVQELVYLQAVRGSLDQARDVKDLKAVLDRLEKFQSAAVERRQRAIDLSVKQLGITQGRDGTVGVTPAPVLDKSQARLPQPGTVEDGYRFKGGDPNKPENWERVQ